MAEKLIFEHSRSGRQAYAQNPGGSVDASGIPEALLRVADELNNQYVVTYGRPERLIPPEKLQVTVTRPGVTVRARTKVSGQ